MMRKYKINTRKYLQNFNDLIKEKKKEINNATPFQIQHPSIER